MNKENRKTSFSAGSGTSMVLVILVLLCLVTFTVLSYATASADYSTTKESADYVSEYYTALSNAEEKIAECIEEGYVGEFYLVENINEYKYLEINLSINENGGIENKTVVTKVNYDEKEEKSSQHFILSR